MESVFSGRDLFVNLPQISTGFALLVSACNCAVCAVGVHM